MLLGLNGINGSNSPPTYCSIKRTAAELMIFFFSVFSEFFFSVFFLPSGGTHQAHQAPASQKVVST
jgi:hypothetical protein